MPLSNLPKSPSSINIWVCSAYRSGDSSAIVSCVVADFFFFGAVSRKKSKKAPVIDEDGEDENGKRVGCEHWLIDSFKELCM